VFLDSGDEALDLLEVKGRTQALIDRLEGEGAYVHIPRADRDYAVTVGLRMLTLRHFVTEADGLYRASEDERDMLRYYANAIEHFLPDAQAS
jgi:glycerol-3-phosphate O-acyltransferase